MSARSLSMSACMWDRVSSASATSTWMCASRAANSALASSAARRTCTRLAGQDVLLCGA